MTSGQTEGRECHGEVQESETEVVWAREDQEYVGRKTLDIGERSWRSG